jgi:hypothetical protein
VNNNNTERGLSQQQLSRMEKERKKRKAKRNGDVKITKNCETETIQTAKTSDEQPKKKTKQTESAKTIQTAKTSNEQPKKTTKQTESAKKYDGTENDKKDKIHDKKKKQKTNVETSNAKEKEPKRRQKRTDKAQQAARIKFWKKKHLCKKNCLTEIKDANIRVDKFLQLCRDADMDPSDEIISIAELYEELAKKLRSKLVRV